MNTALIEKYHGDLTDPATLRERHRVHWMCSQAIGQDVLHIGCRHGTACIILGREGFHCTGVDIGGPSLTSAQQKLANEEELIRRRVMFQTADVTHLPFHNTSFDTVILGDFLEHLTHPKKVLAEARRVLRGSGRLIVTVPYGLTGVAHKQVFYPLSVLELLQPYFRTSSIDVSEDWILYTGANDPTYRFAEVPKEAMFEECVRLGKAVEARSLEKDRALLEKDSRLSAHRQTLRSQGSRIDELEETVAERDARCRELETALEQTHRSLAALQNRLAGAEASEARLNGEVEKLSDGLAESKRRLETVQAENARLRQEMATSHSESQERISQVERLHATELRERKRHFQELFAKKEANWTRKAANARVRELVRAAVPVDGRVLVISNGDDDLIQLEGRCGSHFPQATGGVYAGHHPKDAAEAIGHLETLKTKGAEYLLIPAHAYWWLEFYEDLRRYLETSGSLLLYDANTCAIYRLRALAGDGLFTCGKATQQDQAGEKSPTPAPSFASPDELEASHSALAKRPDVPNLAVILDRFTTDCLRPDCRLLTLRPAGWKKALEQESPEAIFVESAWSGNDGAWLNRLANLQSPSEDELRELLQWAQQRSLPSIFWNKEDPVHFDRFINTARLFSHVFTTDAGCIPRYRQELGHDRVFALPFAAQPAIHNPIQTEPRDGRVCFAGSYYGSRHAARQADMEQILAPAIPFGLEIYDRQYGMSGKGADYAFPEIYQPCIRGRLEYEEMVKAYKRYRVFLNVNSVKHSSTMFSRRVFELLACGTPVISTYSAGIVELLGEDIVFLTETEADTQKHLETLLGDDKQWARASIRGIRKVMGEHTYRDRLQEVLERAGLTLPKPPEPRVSIIVRIESEAEAKRLAAMLSAQTYRRFDIVLISETPLPAHAFKPLQHALPEQPLVPIVGSVDAVSEACLRASTAEYVAVLDVRDSYGPNYLMDYRIALSYSQADFLGKHCFYETNGNGDPGVKRPGYEYSDVHSVPSATLVARKEALANVLFNRALTEPRFEAPHHPILSIDRFNYIHHLPGGKTPIPGHVEEAAQHQDIYI